MNGKSLKIIKYIVIIMHSLLLFLYAFATFTTDRFEPAAVFLILITSLNLAYIFTSEDSLISLWFALKRKTLNKEISELQKQLDNLPPNT